MYPSIAGRYELHVRRSQASLPHLLIVAGFNPPCSLAKLAFLGPVARGTPSGGKAAPKPSAQSIPEDGRGRYGRRPRLAERTQHAFLRPAAAHRQLDPAAIAVSLGVYCRPWLTPPRYLCSPSLQGHYETAARCRKQRPCAPTPLRARDWRQFDTAWRWHKHASCAGVAGLLQPRQPAWQLLTRSCQYFQEGLKNRANAAVFGHSLVKKPLLAHRRTGESTADGRGPHICPWSRQAGHPAAARAASCSRPTTRTRAGRFSVSAMPIVALPGLSLQTAARCRCNHAP